MKRFVFFYLFFSTLATSLISQDIKGLDYVDPTIGGVGRILQPTRPTVHLPNEMLRVFPMRNDHIDDQIWYFPLTNASHRLNSLFAILPVEGNNDSSMWSQKLEYRNETTTPYFYSVDFEDSDIGIEFSPEAKSGYFKFDYRSREDHFLRFTLLNPGGEINLIDNRSISGVEEFMGMKGYFYGELDTDILSSDHQDSLDQRGVLLNFGSTPKLVSFRYAISFISIDQAKENLRKEIPDWNFDEVKENAYNKWDEVLSQIKVESDDLAQKRIFYSALYRSYERMVDINEYGKYFSAYDGKIHKSEEPFYVDNWIWDNYIALEPLHMILNPQKEVEKIKSYIKMYEQGGTMPSFALVFGDWPAMTGNYAATWIADAWIKGLRDYDLQKAYEGLKKKSLETTLLPWRNGPATSLDSFYNKNGYFPALYPDEEETVEEVSVPWERRQAVGLTTANSYSDWSISQIASILGKTDDEKLFLERAGFYKNVFRADKGFMWPKDDQGNWIEPYDPRFADRAYFTENNAYIFNWDVKHDLEGLFELMGGRKAALGKLDNLFREELGKTKFDFWKTLPDHSGIVGQFSMGNEPSFHIPYLYNYLGAPWRTQKRMRMLMKTWFPDSVFGYPGDEDGGGMASWLVFSMMGFFQVTPGIPVYSIGSPVFDNITIDLPNGKTFTLIAENNSDKNLFIQAAYLNGKYLEKPWFTHEDLLNGGTVKLVMGDIPNKKWGNRPEDAPPSNMNYKVETEPMP